MFAAMLTGGKEHARQRRLGHGRHPRGARREDGRRHRATFLATVERFNGFARTGVDEDFGRGSTVYDNYYGDPRVKPNPNLGPLEKGPFTAVQLVPGDLGTKGGLLTDEHARVLDESTASVIPGLYAAGNTTASVMGRTYPGPGSTIGPAAVFGYLAAKHAAEASDIGAATAAPQHRKEKEAPHEHPQDPHRRRLDQDLARRTPSAGRSSATCSRRPARTPTCCKPVQRLAIKRLVKLSKGQFSQEMVDELVARAAAGDVPARCSGCRGARRPSRTTAGADAASAPAVERPEWVERLDQGRFAGKTVIVTGAGSGIGRATASRIAREGGRVIAVDVSQERLDEFAAEHAGADIVTLVADITDDAKVAEIVAAAGDRIDGLANVAGIMDDMTPDRRAHRRRLEARLRGQRRRHHEAHARRRARDARAGHRARSSTSPPRRRCAARPRASPTRRRSTPSSASRSRPRSCTARAASA